MLSVTLTPGKVFQPQERVDNTKLNLAASPSVELDGGLSTAQLEDAAVSVAKTNLDPGSSAAADLRAGGVFPVFDIVTARPVFNPRRYPGATDQAKIQAAINAAIAEGGGVILFDQPYTLSDLTAGTLYNGIYHYLWAESGPRVQLTFRGIRNAKLINGNFAESANGVCILGVKGFVDDAVFEGFNCDRSNVVSANHATLGLGIYENAQLLKRVRVLGGYFQNFSNPIVGAGKSFRVQHARFDFPAGDVNPTGAQSLTSYAVTVTPTYGTCEEVALEGNEVNGMGGDVTPHPWTGKSAYGFCDVQAQGLLVRGNVIRRVSDQAIRVEARPIGSSNSWVSAPREIVIAQNRIEFEDITGQSIVSARQGINCFDAGASIAGNRIRNCYQGIFVNGGPAGYDAGQDLTTRLKKIDIVGNDIELAADLAMDDAVAIAAQARRGICVFIARRVKIAENQIAFAGRTSANVVAKYWGVPAISLVTVDDARVGANEVYGPVDTTSAATDRLWLTGLAMESVRKVEVAPNYFRNLNIGVNGATGGSPASSNVEIAEQRMEDVVWPYASLDGVSNDGSKTPTTLHKRVTSAGFRMRKGRTSFACDAATLGGGFVGGYVRVASFLDGINGRIRIWNEGPSPFTHATLEAAYWNDATAGHGGLAQVGFVQEGGTAAFSKARVCVNNAPGDRVCHLDVYVAGLSSNRIFVEVECPFVGYEGLWGAPNLPANMPAGYVDANATGLVEVVFAPGVTMAGGNLTLENGAWNGTHVVMGVNHLWVRASDGVMLYKAGGAPANDSDGHAF